MDSKQTAAFIAACCVCWSFARATRAIARANNVIASEELSFMDHPLSTLHEGVLGQGNENGAAKFRRSVFVCFWMAAQALSANKISSPACLQWNPTDFLRSKGRMKLEKAHAGPSLQRSGKAWYKAPGLTTGPSTLPVKQRRRSSSVPARAEQLANDTHAACGYAVLEHDKKILPRT
jgi:hypothetical protein